MANEQRVRPRKRKKVCAFCVDKMTSIDYKDTAPTSSCQQASEIKQTFFFTK